MVIKSVNLETVCGVTSKIPDNTLPEIAFAGKSNVGKSSLIKLMMMEEKPTSGRIVIGDVDLAEVGRSGVPYFRREIGVVFQDFRIIQSFSVYENIALAMEMLGCDRKSIDRRIDIVLDLVGLSDKRNEMPDHLSGGEQQRVAIARAVVNLPGLIIADEPTGNLDAHNSIEIMKLLQKINSLGATVIVSTHEKDIVEETGQRVISLAHGVRQLSQD